MRITNFGDHELESVSKALAEACTGQELTRLLSQADIEQQISSNETKWKRIYYALSARQELDRCANNILMFIQLVLSPVRFVSCDPQDHAGHLASVNQVLAFSGLRITEEGCIEAVKQAKSVSDAQKRADELRAELIRRKVHNDVLMFCRAELMQSNYFHAILEATKSVAEKLRSRTGASGDGHRLVDTVFNVDRPLLAWTALSSESEKSDHKGFANMLKGMFSSYRNTTAHEPKILSPRTREDALDLLMIVSFFHRKIDDAHRTPFQA